MAPFWSKQSENPAKSHETPDSSSTEAGSQKKWSDEVVQAFAIKKTGSDSQTPTVHPGAKAQESAPIYMDNPFAAKPAQTVNPVERPAAPAQPPAHEVAKPQIEKPQVEKPQIEHSRYQTPPSPESPARTVELRLKDGNGQRASADAVVRVPENFDPHKPINLVVYNHGFYDSASSAYKHADLDKQMRSAPPNTVLIVPEWQASPGARSYATGHFNEQNRFRNLVNEAFAHTPGLSGKTLNNVDSIHLIGHSAGHQGVETELYKNGLGDKVKSVTLLDSLYRPTALDPWIHSNIRALADGSKQYTNISIQDKNSTFAASLGQAGRVKEWLREARLGQSNMHEDYSHPNTPVSVDDLDKYSINFKRVPDGTHMQLPNIYVQRVVKAEN